MIAPRILIAGVGNIFLGDDAFGVEVAQRLGQRPLPAGVRVIDFGIRGLDLTYALLDGYETVILVDATPRGGRPGTLYVIKPDIDTTPQPENASLMIDTHDLDPAKVLRLAAALGSPVRQVLLVGCEPGGVTDESEVQMEMTDPVRRAVDEAIPLIETLVERLLCEDRQAVVAP
jgi:hydrogenase maturation protease